MPTASPPTAARVDREIRTVAAMVAIFCRSRHGPRAVPCPDCAALLDYASARAARCPRLPRKPPCKDCPTHCYRRDMRERIREVMRFAGPRMALRHPWLALLHALDGRSARRRPPSAVPGTPLPGRGGQGAAVEAEGFRNR